MDINGLEPDLDDLISLHMGLDGYDHWNTLTLLNKTYPDKEPEDLGVKITNQALKNGFTYFWNQNFTMVDKIDWSNHAKPQDRPPDFLLRNKRDKIKKVFTVVREDTLNSGYNNVIAVGWKNSNGGEYILYQDNTINTYKRDLADINAPKRVEEAFKSIPSDGMDFNIHADDFYAFLLNIYIIDQTHDFRDHRMRYTQPKSKKGSKAKNSLRKTAKEDVQLFWMRTLFIIGGGLEIVSKLKPDSDPKVLEKARQGLETIIKTIPCKANNQLNNQWKTFLENMKDIEIIPINSEIEIIPINSEIEKNTYSAIKAFHEGFIEAIITQFNYNNNAIFNYLTKTGQTFLRGNFLNEWVSNYEYFIENNKRRKLHSPDWTPLQWLDEINKYMSNYLYDSTKNCPDHILWEWWRVFGPKYIKKKTELINFQYNDIQGRKDIRNISADQVMTAFEYFKPITAKKDEPQPTTWLEHTKIIIKSMLINNEEYEICNIYPSPNSLEAVIANFSAIQPEVISKELQNNKYSKVKMRIKGYLMENIPKNSKYIMSNSGKSVGWLCENSNPDCNIKSYVEYWDPQKVVATPVFPTQLANNQVYNYKLTTNISGGDTLFWYCSRTEIYMGCVMYLNKKKIYTRSYSVYEFDESVGHWGKITRDIVAEKVSPEKEEGYPNWNPNDPKTVWKRPNGKVNETQMAKTMGDYSQIFSALSKNMGLNNSEPKYFITKENITVNPCIRCILHNDHPAEFANIMLYKAIINYDKNYKNMTNLIISQFLSPQIHNSDETSVNYSNHLVNSHSINSIFAPLWLSNIATIKEGKANIYCSKAYKTSNYNMLYKYIRNYLEEKEIIFGNNELSIEIIIIILRLMHYKLRLDIAVFLGIYGLVLKAKDYNTLIIQLQEFAKNNGLFETKKIQVSKVHNMIKVLVKWLENTGIYNKNPDNNSKVQNGYDYWAKDSTVVKVELDGTKTFCKVKGTHKLKEVNIPLFECTQKNFVWLGMPETLSEASNKYLVIKNGSWYYSKKYKYSELEARKNFIENHLLRNKQWENLDVYIENFNSYLHLFMKENPQIEQNYQLINEWNNLYSKLKEKCEWLIQYKKGKEWFIIENWIDTDKNELIKYYYEIVFLINENYKFYKKLNEAKKQLNLGLVQSDIIEFDSKNNKKSKKKNISRNNKKSKKKNISRNNKKSKKKNIFTNNKKYLQNLKS